jgi:hypothetical protein
MLEILGLKIANTLLMAKREPAYAVSSVDAVLEKLGGGEMSAMRQEPRKLKSGEHKLALEMLELALKDAVTPPSTKKKALNREEARAWLRDDAAIFSARVCFEALGIDYDAAIQKLEQQWAHA